MAREGGDEVWLTTATWTSLPASGGITANWKKPLGALSKTAWRGRVEVSVFVEELEPMERTVKLTCRCSGISPSPGAGSI